MGRDKLKTTSGILSLLSSIMFVIASPISFLIILVALIETKYEIFSFLVFFYAIYYFTVSIIMITKFKTRKKAIKSTLRIILSNAITIAMFTVFLVKFFSLADTETTWGELFPVFIVIFSGPIYIFSGIFALIFSLISIAVATIYLIPLLNESSKEINLAIKENKEYMKSEIKRIKDTKKDNNKNKLNDKEN